MSLSPLPDAALETGAIPMSVCNPCPTLPNLQAELAFYLRRAYESVGGPAALDALGRCLFLIDARALTTTDHALLRHRLRNAQRYSLQAEWGAARFELRLLLHALAATT
jgi:hypothetical protein